MFKLFDLYFTRSAHFCASKCHSSQVVTFVIDSYKFTLWNETKATATTAVVTTATTTTDNTIAAVVEAGPTNIVSTSVKMNFGTA